MSQPLATLNNFLRSVPVCQQEADINTLVKIFQSGQDETVVVVNQQLFPIGFINCHRLFPYLLDWLSAPNQSFATYPGGKPLVLPEIEIQSLMETTMAIIPSTLTIQGFFPYLQASTSDLIFAVVDSQEKFLGLLDCQLALKYLAMAPEIPATIPEVQTLLASLAEVIEELPIPLMLQTPDGQILGQNLLWREQINQLIPHKQNQALRVLAMSSPQDKQSQSNFSSTPSNPVPKFFSPEVFLTEHFTHRQSPEITEQKMICHRQDIWQFCQLPISLPIFPSSIWVVVARDLRQQEKKYSQLTAKNALSYQMLQLKNELFQSFSHELKSPITALIGLSSLLQEPKLGELNQRQAVYTQQIYRSSRQLMTLVNQILELIRLERGESKIIPKLLAIKPLCESIYTEIIADKSLQKSQFSLNIEAGLETLFADEMGLRQMLVNLLKNAINLTPVGGQIGLDISCWTGWIVFNVWDTGVGIFPESQPFICQKCQSPKTSLQPIFPMTGLELILTELLAFAHGGDISFVSQPGKGSRFTLLLPATFPPTTINSALNKLILIVEAIPEYINDLNNQLGELGYLVITARTIVEAQRKAHQLKPAIIFLNPNLSLGSGWDVLTLLKSDFATQNIPIIITGTQVEKEKALQMQANGFLSLPIEREVLIELLYHTHQPPSPPIKSLTILFFSPHSEELNISQLSEDSELEMALHNYTSSFHHHLIHVDSLEQAEILAHIWNLDVILLDGRQLSDPINYLQSLGNYDSLASLPMVTLDAKTTQAANQIKSLAVFPYLLPINAQNLDKLLEVIHIAAGIN